MDQEILQDLDFEGKPRPWKEKKRANMNLAKVYGRLKDSAEAWRDIYAKYEPLVRDCASTAFYK